VVLDRGEVVSDVERLGPDGEVEEPAGDGPPQPRGQGGGDVVLESDVLMPDREAVPGEDELVTSGAVRLVAGVVVRGERAPEEVLAADGGRARSEGAEERLKLAETATGRAAGDEPRGDPSDLVEDDPVAVRDRASSLHELAVGHDGGEPADDERSDDCAAETKEGAPQGTADRRTDDGDA
jgi:hypothetical protein